MHALNNVVAWFTREDRLMAASILRIGLGAVLLSMYLLHYPFRDFIWGPQAFVSYEMFTRTLEETGGFSVYALSDSPRAFELIFHCGLLVTLLWFLGVCTRITGILTYVFAFSLWARNGFILDGGDNILILVLFFLMFARTGRHLSVTGWLRRRSARARAEPETRAAAPGGRLEAARALLRQARTVLHNAALVAIAAQVSFLYLTSALYKVQGEMWQSGVALYYVLRVQEFTFPGVSEFVYENALLVVAFTYLTVLEQLAYPFMLLNKWTKRLSVFLVVQMHLGIAVLMGLVSFSAVMITVQATTFRDDEFRAVARWAAQAAGHLRSLGLAGSAALRRRLWPAGARGATGPAPEGRRLGGRVAVQ